MLKETKDGWLLKLRISPNASKNEFVKNEEILKVKITAQPIDNKANKALIAFLSKSFKVPKTSIIIVKGETSKEKTLLIKTNDAEKVDAIKMLIM